MNSATPLIPRAVAAFPGPGLLWRTGVAISTYLRAVLPLLIT